MSLEEEGRGRFETDRRREKWQRTRPYEKKKKMKAEIGVTQQEARNRISSRASEESDTLPIA